MLPPFELKSRSWGAVSCLSDSVSSRCWRLDAYRLASLLLRSRPPLLHGTSVPTTQSKTFNSHYVNSASFPKLSLQHGFALAVAIRPSAQASTITFSDVLEDEASRTRDNASIRLVQIFQLRGRRDRVAGALKLRCPASICFDPES